MDAATIKEEPADSDSPNFLSEAPPPEGFQREEWIALTEVVITTIYHGMG